MRGGNWWWVACAVLVVCGGVAGPHGQDQDPREWQFADPAYTLTFPRDHGAHPAYRIEWWYYTGNLETEDGSRRYGYQLTFFRVGIDAEPANPSRWAVRDLHMAHLAITDVARGSHQVAERLNRAGVGWAGASSDTLRVWNEDWRAELDGATHRLRAVSDDGEIALDLRLQPGGPPVLHGDDGFSRKGAAAGNASHYYSLTRLQTEGTVSVDGETIAVGGLSWMDHEFGSSFLEPSQAGWDWFSIQLDDGTDLMVYTMRRLDGTPDPYSSGTVVAPAANLRLTADDYRLVPVRIWASSTSGAAYPVGWRLEVPSLELELDVAAAVDAQELHTDRSTRVTYWEGVIDVTGTRAGESVVGSGYLEMTGYAGPPMSDVLR